MKGGTQMQQQPQAKPHTEPTNTKRPTAEQIRYAQLLNNEDQKVVHEQIRQVADVTGRTIDEVSVALHDCNFDTEQAINTLLEGRFDQSEWIVPSNRKKKHQGGGMTQGIDNIQTTGQTGPPPRTSGSRSSRGGRGGGGRNRSSDKSGLDSDQKDGDDNLSRSVESGRGRGSREDRSSDRRPSGGRGGLNRRGRGGGRGRAFSSRGRSGRLGGFGNRSAPPPAPVSNGPTENGTELWDSNEAVDMGKEKSEMWEDSLKPSEEWGQDEWTPAPVTEPVSDSSLFVSVQLSSSWSDSTKDQETSWGDSDIGPTSSTSNGTSVTMGMVPTKREDNHDAIPYPPESVDMAIIHSKLAQNQPDSSAMSNPDIPVLRIPLPGEMRGDNHLGPISKLLNNNAVAAQQNTHQIMQSRPQHQRHPRQSRTKKSQKSQIPVQAVEMPGSMVDSLDVQFGNLEFGGDSDAPLCQTKGVDTAVPLNTEESRDTNQSEVPSVPVEPEHEIPDIPNLPSSMPSTLPSSLSRSAPVTIASTTSATASLTMVEENSPRHYQHASPREHKPHIPEPIPLPSQREAREEVLQPQIPEQPKTPPSLSSANVTSSLGSVSCNQPTSQPSMQVQLASSLSKENPLETRGYQAAQHVVTQPTLSTKDQLSSVGLGHHNTLGSNIVATPLHRSDLSTTGTLPPHPPPGVGVPHTLHTSTSMGLSTVTVSSSSRPSQHAGKPNLPPGVLPLNTLYGMQQPGLVPAYSLPYSYEDLQRLQMSAYYDVPFQTQGRETLQGTYQTDQKFGRSDASSPVQTSMNQAATPGQHHMQQQAFINAAMAPPYGYGGLAFYPGSGMMPGGFPAYTAPMYQQMPTKTHGTGSQYQQPYSNQHGSHSFNSGYDDLSAGHDFGKSGYHSSVSQTQSKSSSVTSTAGELAGSSYKGQVGKFGDSKAFLGGTPPPALNLSVQGQHSHMTNYPGHTAPFMSMVQAQQHHPPSLFHQQHHVPHHHQDMGQSGLSQRAQQNQLSKQSQSKGHQGAYPGPPFWSNANKSL